MGSWTQGVLAATGLATDLATGIGGLVINAQNAQTNRRLAEAQISAMNENIKLQRRAQDIEFTIGNPMWRYNQAISAGFDTLSAAQFAGKGAPRISGMVHLMPLKQLEVDGINRTHLASAGLLAGQLFTHGAPGPKHNMPFSRLQAGQGPLRSGSIAKVSAKYGTWSSQSTVSTTLSAGPSPRPVTIGHAGARRTWSTSSA
uniref:Minor structural protein n=1 Tax=Chaerephon bat calicivirus TaxID=3141859 RepID=A0AAU7E365_9CALI